MASVGQRNTGPEVAVRKLLFRCGYRYRVHRKELPGTPDIVFPTRRKVIFVHGCFWHGHDCSKGALPKSRGDFWGEKIGRNRQRDSTNVATLAERGWSILIVWQCELREPEKLLCRMCRFLDSEAVNCNDAAYTPNSTHAKDLPPNRR